jgi:hypothetical protein
MSTSDMTPNTEPAPSVRIPALNRRQAMDWSLVLISQSISSKPQADAEGLHWLEVAAEDGTRAEEILRLYSVSTAKKTAAGVGNVAFPRRRSFSTGAACSGWR